MKKKLRLREILFPPQKDERIAGEINKIYRVGYMILSLGLMVDIFLQSIQGTIRILEFLTFVLANVVCAVLMARRGIGDEGKYAEADVFPKRHTALVALGASAAAAFLMTVLRTVAQLPAWKWDLWVFWVSQIFIFVSMLVLCAPAIYAGQYALFCAARRRRKRMEDAEVEETE